MADPRWRNHSVAKIHEACGGLVRWVEAVDRPGVGWTGECLDCGRENIPRERMIPLDLDSDEQAVLLVNETDREILARLEWNEDADWTENQNRLREAIN
jgi:hypothetical protein